MSKVWDISHYLIGGRSCSDEEHAKRQALWDTFPMMKWVRHIEHIHVPHLDFRSMTAGHKPDTPHLLNSFRGHLRVINSIDFFENKYGRWGVYRYSRVLVREVGRLSSFTRSSTAGGASIVIHAFWYGRWGVYRYSRVLVRQVGRLSLFTRSSTAGAASIVIHAF